MERVNSKTEEVYQNRLDTIASIKKLDLKPALYVGTYVHDVYGTIKISSANETEFDVLFEHHYGLGARLQPLGGERFLITYSDPTFGKAVVKFTTEEDRVTDFELKVNPFLEVGSYHFKKL